MIPFRVSFRPGVSLFEQIVYASKKAMVSGQMRPGDPFPSVRTLSKELKINPNTAHKIVAYLVGEGLLETRPGIGTLVAALPDSTRKERTQLLGHEIEELVVEAKRLGIGREEMLTSISAHWQRLSSDDLEAAGKSNDGGKQSPMSPMNPTIRTQNLSGPRADRARRAILRTRSAGTRRAH